MTTPRTERRVDWRRITERIKNGKCALIIGPDFTTSVSGKTHREALSEYITTHEYGKDYYSLEKPLVIPDDEIFPFSVSQFREIDDHAFAIADFFEDLPANPLFDQLAEIPFHLIISLSADQMMYRALEKAGKQFQHDFYRKGYNPKEIKNEPTADYPLLYQLFGSVEERDSLILTYQDLFKYIQGIFGNYSLPETLRESVNRCESFIFLGVQYEKWYLKLLLQVLGLHEPSKMINACRAEQKLEAHVEAFYANVLSVAFIESDFSSYVTGLSEAWKRAMPSGDDGQTEISQDSVLKLVKNGDVDSAYSLLDRMESDIRKPVLCAKTITQHKYLWLDLVKAFLEENKFIPALNMLDWTNDDEVLAGDITMAKSMVNALIRDRETLSESEADVKQAKTIRKIDYILQELLESSPCE